MASPWEKDTQIKGPWDKDESPSATMTAPPPPKPQLPELLRTSGNTGAHNPYGSDYDSPLPKQNQWLPKFEQDHPVMGGVLRGVASDPGIIPMETGIAGAAEPLFNTPRMAAAAIKGGAKAAAGQIRPLLTGMNPLEHPLKVLPDLYDAAKAVGQGAKGAMSDYQAAQRVGQIGSPAWRNMPETGAPLTPDQPSTLPPSVLPSGRVPGPATLPPSPIRVPGWEGRTTVSPRPQPDLSPIPGELPSGRVPGSIAAQDVELVPTRPQRTPSWQGMPEPGSTLPPKPDLSPIKGNLPTGRVPGSIAAQDNPPLPKSQLDTSALGPPGIERVKGLPKEITGDMMAVDNPQNIPPRYGGTNKQAQNQWALDRKMAGNLIKSGATSTDLADAVKVPDEQLVEIRNLHGATKTTAKPGSPELAQRRAHLVEAMKELEAQGSTLPPPPQIGAQ